MQQRPRLASKGATAMSMMDAQKTDWVEKMASKLSITWLWLARTAPGAELIAEDFEATLNFWSGQVPLQEMENVIDFGAREGTLHAVNFVGPCWGCSQRCH